jgi:hypothetical protein
MKPYIALLVLFALASVAKAQDSRALNPADPAAKVPAMKYESAFAGYAPYREEKLAPWREVNDEVGRIKGHVGIFGGHGGHGSGGQAGRAKPVPGQPEAAPSKEPAGQSPARGEPAAPAGRHKGH